MAPYVALSLVSIQRVLGDAFLLLTPQNTPDYIGRDYFKKSWRFNSLEFDFSPDVASIVAKSDFIRMAYVYHQGGFWLDADSILFAALQPCVFPKTLGDRLYWYSEALFGAERGNPLLGKAIDNCLSIALQEWANPGDIRALIENKADAIVPIPYVHLDPGYRPAYNFNTCEILQDRHLPIEAFLFNPNLKLLKLYNTYFSRSAMMNYSVADFLQSGMLLSRIFLHIEPDPAYWISKTNALARMTESA